MSLCEFIALDNSKPWRLKCLTCGHETNPLNVEPGQVNRECSGNGKPKEKPPGFPGTELLNLTAELGIRHPKRCDCKRLARWMDRIGVNGCLVHFQHIVGRVRDNAAIWGWKDKLFNTATAAWKAVLSGLVLQIDPRDPIPGLVEIAIRRAEKKAKEPQPVTPPQVVQIAPQPLKDWVDPLVIWNRFMEPTTALRNILAGRDVFLAGGGPSANTHPLEQLNLRGTWTMCVNNMAGHHRFRPHAFVCTDPPEKFCDSIWLDPQIMKFIPDAKLEGGRAKIRTKKQDGTFVPTERNGQQIFTRDCPNTWGVKRRKWMFCDDTFFTDDAAPNGNYSEGVAKTGERKTICTMLFAIRILRHLGARRVFLIGVDFKMDPTKEAHENYAFGELRDPGACHSNNSQYVIVNDWLVRLQAAGVFAKFGMELYNCNQFSGLKAFPYVPFETALKFVRDGVEQTPSLAGWYVKDPKEPRKKRRRGK